MSSSPSTEPRPLTRIWRNLPAALWPFAADAPPQHRFVAAGLCAAFGIIAAIAHRSGAPLVFWACMIVAYLAGGLRATRVAILALREGQPDINLLMILAAIVSAILGHWDEGAILLFLFTLSDALERFAIERTRRSIRALMDLRPQTACVVREGREFTVPIEELRVGDVARVRPGERFPIDGEVLEGNSPVDEAIVTGESMPVEKQPGSSIFAGTINGNGLLLVRMTRPAADSTIARIVKLVEQAQENRATAQRVIEKWQTPYVLAVLGVSALTILVNLIHTGQLVGAVQTGMVLLVAASPCAVVLASPVAVLAAVTRGARHGVLFKGGTHLERLATITTIVFDKTGTLTSGRPVVSAVEPADGQSRAGLLATTAALERFSEHPLAAAIVRAAREQHLEIPEATEFIYEPGLGVSGRVNDRWVGAGRLKLFERHRVRVPAALDERMRTAEGETKVLVLDADGAGGVLLLTDEIRPEASAALAQLRSMGISHLLMLTGDQPEPARRVAERVNISEVRAGLRPEDKLAEVHRLAKDNGGVAMVGDGVNDAPALAAATVGVAMGAAGSDVALETADVVLMRSDLRSLVEALHLARRCRAVIQQSLGFAFGVIALLVLLTLAGWLILPVAVVCHEGSTVLVVLNGLRLLREPAVWAGPGQRT